MDLYEGGIREPFIARWPGKIAEGSTSELISTQYDFFATIASKRVITFVFIYLLSEISIAANVNVLVLL